MRRIYLASVPLAWQLDLGLGEAGDVSVAPIELSQSNSKLEKEVAELRQSKKE